MNKQLRDVSPELQHDLRRATTDATAKLGKALSAELAGVGAAYETVRRADAELTDIADDLTTLATLRQRAHDLLTPPSVSPPVGSRHLTLAASASPPTPAKSPRAGRGGDNGDDVRLKHAD